MQVQPEAISGASTIIQSFTSSPERWGDPLCYIAGGVVAAGYAFALYKLSDPERITGFAHEPSDIGLMRQAVIDVNSGEDKTSEIKSRSYRVRGPLAIGLGLIA